MKIQMEKESRYTSRVVHTSVGTVTQVSNRFVEPERENKKVVVNIEQNTKHIYECGDKCVWICKRRQMRIHIYIHVRRNQTNEDVDGKRFQAYSQVYAYTGINRHRDIGVYQICRKRRNKTKRWLGIQDEHSVFGLLYRHTISESIISDTHTSGAQ